MVLVTGKLLRGFIKRYISGLFHKFTSNQYQARSTEALKIYCGKLKKSTALFYILYIL